MSSADPARRTDQPTVTLIVPIRNEAAHIADCLRAVRAQTYPPELIEIIVVDGASTDATRSIVEGQIVEDSRIKLLDNPDRLMPLGLNIGIRAATGRYVGVVSGHSVLPADYVVTAVQALEATGAWCVGGRIVRVASQPMQQAIAMATASRVGVGDSLHNYAQAAGWVETVFPGFWLREVFDRVGLFDPKMLVNEDNELSYRIREAGGRIWYDPAIAVEYVPRASLPALFHQYRRYALGKMRVLRKHHGGVRWRHLVPAAWLGFLIGGGIATVFAPALRLIWLAGIALYLGTILIASLRLSGPGMAWWRVAAALMTLHTAYGLGIWQGLATWFADQ